MNKIGNLVADPADYRYGQAEVIWTSKGPCERTQLRLVTLQDEDDRTVAHMFDCVGVDFREYDFTGWIIYTNDEGTDLLAMAGGLSRYQQKTAIPAVEAFLRDKYPKYLDGSSHWWSRDDEEEILINGAPGEYVAMLAARSGSPKAAYYAARVRHDLPKRSSQRIAA